MNPKSHRSHASAGFHNRELLLNSASVRKSDLEEIASWLSHERNHLDLPFEEINHFVRLWYVRARQLGLRRHLVVGGVPVASCHDMTVGRIKLKGHNPHYLPFTEVCTDHHVENFLNGIWDRSDNTICLRGRQRDDFLGPCLGPWLAPVPDIPPDSRWSRPLFDSSNSRYGPSRLQIAFSHLLNHFKEICGTKWIHFYELGTREYTRERSHAVLLSPWPVYGLREIDTHRDPSAPVQWRNGQWYYDVRQRGREEWDHPEFVLALPHGARGIRFSADDFRLRFVNHTRLCVPSLTADKQCTRSTAAEALRQVGLYVLSVPTTNASNET